MELPSLEHRIVAVTLRWVFFVEGYSKLVYHCVLLVEVFLFCKDLPIDLGMSPFVVSIVMKNLSLPINNLLFVVNLGY